MPQSFFRSLGGLGQGIGFALGEKLAAPSRPVVLVVGDGSFLYNPVAIEVLNNKMYRGMMQGHVHHYRMASPGQCGRAAGKVAIEAALCLAVCGRQGRTDVAMSGDHMMAHEARGFVASLRHHRLKDCFVFFPDALG